MRYIQHENNVLTRKRDAKHRPRYKTIPCRLSHRWAQQLHRIRFQHSLVRRNKKWGVWWRGARTGKGDCSVSPAASRTKGGVSAAHAVMGILIPTRFAQPLPARASAACRGSVPKGFPSRTKIEVLTDVGNGRATREGTTHEVMALHPSCFDNQKQAHPESLGYARTYSGY